MDQDHFNRPRDCLYYFEIGPRLMQALENIFGKDTDMSQLIEAVEAVRVAVEANTAVDSSAISLLQGLTNLVNDLKSQVALAADVPAAVEAVNAFAATLAASNTMLADAVTANTPAA